MNSIEVKYFHRFLMHLQNYFNEIRGMKILISTTASKAAEVAKDATMKRKGKMLNLKIMIYLTLFNSTPFSDRNRKS